jgi:hypothetical protein
VAYLRPLMPMVFVGVFMVVCPSNCAVTLSERMGNGTGAQ